MPSTLASALMLIGGVALASLVLVSRSWGSRSRSKRKESRPDDNGRLAAGNTPREILHWQVEMHDTARDVKAEIDTKLAALQALTLAARQERERLEAAIARAERVEFDRTGA